MLKVVVVEDEELVRKGIVLTVDWAGAGCAAPFDILPAVWLASAISVTVGILAVKLFSRLWPRPGTAAVRPGRGV